jgi:hypothetical protein
MSFESRCPQCVFLSRHLGRLTPCLLHVGSADAPPPSAHAERATVERAYDEPYEFGRVRPSVDRLGPFSLREYTRLLLLRSRVRDARSGGAAGAISTDACSSLT